MGEDEKFMKLALKLASKGAPSPNPYVGAVIVKEGKIIGKGYHKRAGMPHAEVEAIKSVEDKAELRGSTMYVTLEPCNHWGRTPPCTKAIIEAGIKKVVFATEDPNPVADGGKEKLAQAGVEIAEGVLGGEAARMNEAFLKYAKTKTPFVVLKAAMSLDGKIATKTGDSKWITGEKARKYARKLRGRCDGVLVGINTILKDNPLLTGTRNGKDPLRVVLDDRLRIPLSANVVGPNLLVATTENAEEKKAEELEEAGAEVIICGKERVDVKKLLSILGEKGIASVFVEGGSEVHGSFVDEKLVDKFVLFYAPKIIGGREAVCAIGGKGVEDVQHALSLSNIRVKKIGEDVVIEGYPKQAIEI